MRNIKILVILGIILIAIGSVALFYHAIHRVGQPPEAVTSQVVYPYQGGGIFLVVTRIIFIAVGFLLKKP